MLIRSVRRCCLPSGLIDMTEELTLGLLTLAISHTGFLRSCFRQLLGWL